MIFQSELSTLGSEISQLLAQVEAARQKQAQLTELDALTDSSLTQLRDVVSKVGHYAPDAIANLKSAVLTLFDSGVSGIDSGEPIAPTIDDDVLEYSTLEGQSCEFASFLELDKPLGAGDRFWHGATWSTGTVIQRLGDVECKVQIDGAIGTVTLDRPKLHYMPTSLEGQSCDIDTAPATGQSCTWASPLCSLIWEDTPLLGQHCTITPSATEDNENNSTSEGKQMPYIELVQHPQNSAIAYQRKHDGEIICVYVGFKTKAHAQSWLHFFEAVTSRVQLRQAKRLESYKWEVKVQGVSVKQIERYARDCDFSKNYRPEIGSAKPPKTEVVLPINKVKPGQRIRTKDGLELTIRSAGCFDDKTFFAKDANDQRQLIKLEDVAEFLEATESTAQQLGLEPPSGWRQVQPLEQSIQENAGILEVGDIVEIVGSRHPQHFGLVGAVESLNHFSELPISVRTPRGLKGYLRSDLKLISKGEAPKRQGLEPGQLLTGNRIVTNGNYIGLRRSAASFNTVERIATIQLAKDLQNLGFDPQLAVTVMAGGEVDDASDF